MIPFRELELYDSFLLDGKECDKIGNLKYIVLDKNGEPKSLHSADPNLMVEMLDEEMDEESLEELESHVDELDISNDKLGHYFFSTLLSLVEAAEEAGEEYMQTKHLRIISESYLSGESSED